MKKIYVVISAFNEGERIIEVIKNVLKYKKGFVVVVDDGSYDNTQALLKKNFVKDSRVTLLRHIVNLGKGAAMKTGAEEAWRLGASAVVFIDGDGQHDPKYLSQFEKLLGKYGLVFSYRQIQKMPLVRKCGNIIVREVIKILFNIRRRDLLCGFMAMDRFVYSEILWQTSGYGVETEIATKVGRKRLDFGEILIDTVYIDKYKGVTIIDAIKILMSIPVWYFARKV